MSDSWPLNNVLITGGASGLGAAVADMIKEASGNPVVLDRIRPKNGHDHILVDIADSAAAERAVGKVVRSHGHISAVVTCAGTEASGPIDKISREDWDRVISVNLMGTAAVIRAALPHLVKSRGKVVTVSSSIGPKAVGDATAYCASKFGVIGFTRALAAETQGRIGVTLLIPGGEDATLSEPANVAAAVLYALRQPSGKEECPSCLKKSIFKE